MEQPISCKFWTYERFQSSNWLPSRGLFSKFFMQLVSRLAWQSHVISKWVSVLNTSINETWRTQNVKLNHSIDSITASVHSDCSPFFPNYSTCKIGSSQRSSPFDFSFDKNWSLPVGLDQVIRKSDPRLPHTHCSLLSYSIHKSGIVTGLLNNGRNWLTAHKIKLWLFQQLKSTDWQSWIIAPSSTKHDVKSPPIIAPPQYSKDLWFHFWGQRDLSMHFAVTGLTQWRREFN